MFYNHNTVEMCSIITPNNIEINIKCKDTRIYNHCRNVKSAETGRQIVLYNQSVVEM